MRDKLRQPRLLHAMSLIDAPATLTIERTLFMIEITLLISFPRRQPKF